MRKLVMSDIHGCFNEMIALLEAADYKPADDLIVICGDLIDRGPDSAKVVKYWYEIQNSHPHRCIVLRGNHEQMMHWCLSGITTMWLQHGGMEAVVSFRQEFSQETDLRTHLEWLLSQPLMHVDEEYVYVHAGIHPKWAYHCQTSDDVLWMPAKDFYQYSVEAVLQSTEGRKVVHGHAPYWCVQDDEARIRCDLGAAVTERPKLALVDLTNDMYWEYDFRTKKIAAKKIQRK